MSFFKFFGFVFGSILIFVSAMLFIVLGLNDATTADGILSSTAVSVPSSDVAVATTDDDTTSCDVMDRAEGIRITEGPKFPPLQPKECGNVASYKVCNRGQKAFVYMFIVNVDPLFASMTLTITRDGVFNRYTYRELEKRFIFAEREEEEIPSGECLDVSIMGCAPNEGVVIPAEVKNIEVYVERYEYANSN